MSAFGTLSASTTAVLFIEFQNEFASEGGKLNAAVQPCMDAVGTVDNASKVLEACRAKGIKVLHAPITFSDDFRELSTAGYGILANVKAGECFKASQWGGAIIDKMQPTPEEIVVTGKRGLCGFASTNLDFILRQHGITTLAICGFLTNCCVESSMRTAYEKGYKVITLHDCCGATSVEQHEAAVKFTFPMFSVPQTSSDFIASLE